MQPVYRQAQLDDIASIFEVRTSVRENYLDRDGLRELGITEESVAASLETDHGAWVAECDDNVVGFSMANVGDGSIFALFVLPDFEGLGIGGRLLALAADWLRDQGLEAAWLTTDESTRAAAFYERQGWRTDGKVDDGEIRYELDLTDR